MAIKSLSPYCGDRVKAPFINVTFTLKQSFFFVSEFALDNDSFIGKDGF
ncbi:hypothetical protein MAMP_00299 [Methylophaga aminisulfidivorans MP]|uniref:Uncharacterized protein n=1 Tax=Methylophaga aminisulfidivorans MP TaxID=1026882 RepID=F5T1J6_9GAMM|nr:hypothetical protein MAMP_00299 [Methylophaga aminisulfidivorans MP]